MEWTKQRAQPSLAFIPESSRFDASAYRQPCYYGSQIGASLSWYWHYQLSSSEMQPHPNRVAAVVLLRHGCVLRGHRVNAAYKGGAGFILPPLVAIVRSFVIRIPSKAALSAVINVTRDILDEWNESSKPSVFLLPSKSFPLCFPPSFSLVLQVFLRSSRRREPLQGRGEGRRRIGETRTDIRFLFDDGFAPLEWMSE